MTTATRKAPSETTATTRQNSEVRSKRDLRAIRKSNPVAKWLEEASNWLACDIETVVKTVLPNLSMGTTLNQGWISKFALDGKGEERVATNRECADWRDGIEIQFCFDLRKDLPEQVSQWLRTLAGKLAEAADQVAEIKDPRNKALLRRLVAENGCVDRMEADGKCIGFFGQLADKEEFERELNATEGGAT